MSKIRTLIISLFLFAFVGCSTTGRMNQLIVMPDEIKIANTHNAIVRVGVIGGDRRFVSSEMFKAALLESLKTTKVFSTPINVGNAHYDLFVILLRSENRGLGGRYLITSKWTLRSENGTDVWSEIITSQGRSFAFAGVARIRAASERASKDAISKGIEMLSQLSL